MATKRPAPRIQGRRGYVVPMAMRGNGSGRLAWAAERPRLFAVLAVAAALAGALAGAVSAAGPFFFMSCDPDELAEHQLGETSVVLASNGAVLATIAADEQNRPVELQQISPLLREATVAIEDRRFYEHRGIDYRGVLRALVRDLESREAAEGGSTITQQLARTLYLDREKTIGRKLAEGCIAAEMEQRWSKDRILETYLNRVYYGNRATGADAAARTYFSKPPSELTLPEAALLAGLPQAPSRLDPLSRPEDAKTRRDHVLEAMAETGEISEEELAEARDAPLQLNPSPNFGEQRDAYLANYVHELLVEEYGEAAARRGGFQVHTTIDGRLQQLAREAIEGTLDRDGDPAASIVAVDPEQGAVRAMVAVVPGESSVAFNFAVEGRRQAGSTFKTFALAEAVKRGIDPWSTEYLSAPFSGPESEGEPWQVKTYDETYVGRVPLAGATTRSDNTVYARLIVDLGPEEVLETARAMGIRSELPAVPSIVLGSGSVSVLEMTVGYATLANGGERVEPRLIQKVVRPDGREDTGGWGEQEREEALPEGAVRHVTGVLAQNIVSGTGTGAQIGRPAAGKTGTTDDHSDAWFSGYTPQLATTVWVGYPDRQEPMTDVHGTAVTGGSFPATIWQRFMAPAHEGLPVVEFPAPPDVDWRRWCGRVQFAASMAEARPDNRCPERPVTTATTEDEEESETERQARPATTQEEPPEEEPPPPPPTTTAEAPAPPPAEPGPLPPPQNAVGRRGIVTADIPEADGTGAPALGEVQVAQYLWPAASEDGAPIPRRVEVDVVGIEADHLIVRPRPRGG
jgi:penicillin-binding protein 1A